MTVTTQAVQGLVVLACLLCLLATIYATIGLFKKDFRGWLVSVYLIMSGICMTIALSVFSGHEKAKVTTGGRMFFLHGWSFVLAGSSTAGCFFCSIYSAFAKLDLPY